MYKIYIDTTERFENKVILKKLKQNEVIEEALEVDAIQGNIDIVDSIQKLLVRNSLDLLAIKEFVPNRGPGSFTGVKIGVTIANVLNWVLEIKSQEALAVPDYGKQPNIT